MAWYKETFQCIMRFEFHTFNFVRFILVESAVSDATSFAENISLLVLGMKHFKIDVIYFSFEYV